MGKDSAAPQRTVNARVGAVAPPSQGLADGLEDDGLVLDPRGAVDAVSDGDLEEHRDVGADEGVARVRLQLEVARCGGDGGEEIAVDDVGDRTDSEIEGTDADLDVDDGRERRDELAERKRREVDGELRDQRLPRAHM